MRKSLIVFGAVLALAMGSSMAQSYGAARIQHGTNGSTTILYGSQNFNGNGYYDGRYGPTYQGNGAARSIHYGSYANGQFVEGMIAGAVLDRFYQNSTRMPDYSHMGPQYSGVYMQQYIEQQGVYNRPPPVVNQVRPGYSQPQLVTSEPVFVQKQRFNQKCNCIELFYEQIQ